MEVVLSARAGVCSYGGGTALKGVEIISAKMDETRYTLKYTALFP